MNSAVLIPARIGEFVETFRPTSFDFENDNHRSGGTDIALFGNDLLTGKNKGKTYKNVEIFRYPLYRSVDICYALKTAVLKGMRRLDSNKTENWSIAVLVPTKRLMLAVSNYLSAAENKLPALVHDVALDQEGLALSASAIAALLEGGKTKLEISHKLIESLCMHIRGRRGGNDTTPQMELELADALDSYRSSGVVRGKKRQEIVAESLNIAEQRLNISLSGNPGDDWLQMRSFLEQSNSEFIQNLGTNARYLRLLNKGTVLRQRLNESWRANGFYRGALEIVKDALVQEHFSSSTRMWSGINVMTIHKAKGKEFDEVFIFDGYKQGKIVRSKCNAKELAQARLALRVGVTRAMKRTTILSPQIDCCPLL